MTTPEEEEAAVEEDMSTAVRADAALNKDKDSASSGKTVKTVKCTFPFSLFFCFVFCCVFLSSLFLRPKNFSSALFAAFASTFTQEP